MKSKWASKENTTIKKEENAVKKAYEKPLSKAMDSLDRLLSDLDNIPVQYNRNSKVQLKHYNVRLEGQIGVVKLMLRAVSNLLNEINYDLVKGNYKEGEE